MKTFALSTPTISFAVALLGGCGGAPTGAHATTPSGTTALQGADLRVKYGAPALSPVSFMQSGHPPPLVIEKVGHSAILHLTGYNAVVLASNQPWIGQVTCSETNGIVRNARNTRCFVRKGTFVYVVTSNHSRLRPSIFESRPEEDELAETSSSL